MEAESTSTIEDGKSNCGQTLDNIGERVRVCAVEGSPQGLFKFASTSRSLSS